MSRTIRNARAQQLQGTRAGLATRAIADGIDYGIAFVIYVVLVAAVGLAWDLFFSKKIEISLPPGWISASGVFWVFVVYLALGWGSTGRSLGKQIMGLRVVRADTRALRLGHAFVRALLCAAFFPGLLVVLFHRRNQSLQDLICRTVVVYDWIPEADHPRSFATQTSAT